MEEGFECLAPVKLDDNDDDDDDNNNNNNTSHLIQTNKILFSLNFKYEM